MKISFFIMTFKGLEVLKSLIENNCLSFVDKIIVGEDKSVENDYSLEIIKLCEDNGIDYYHSNQNYEIVTPYALAISWRWIIELKFTKLIVLHDSLLPKYRGFAPLVNSLINGENKIGVTALFASEEYDKGDIILQKESLISYPIKIEKAIEIISFLYSEIVLEIIDKIRLDVELEAFQQVEENVSYSLWRDFEDYFINWNDSSIKIGRFIDAVGYPYQGAKCLIDDRLVTVLDATPIDDVVIENRDVGKVIFFKENKPFVVCGQGLLKIENAIFDDTKTSILPLKKFRSRFK